MTSKEAKEEGEQELASLSLSPAPVVTTTMSNPPSKCGFCLSLIISCHPGHQLRLSHHPSQVNPCKSVSPGFPPSLSQPIPTAITKYHRSGG